MNWSRKIKKDPTILVSAILLASVLISAAFFGLLIIKDVKKPEAYAMESEPEIPSETEQTESERQESSKTESEAPAETRSSEETEPDTTTEPEETETEKAPREITEIHTLSAEELAEIRLSYSDRVRGFGTGLFDVETDEHNRPVQVNELLQRFENMDADVTAYCAGPKTAKAALTFQNGTETGYTEQVLDILKENDIKATFYITHAYAAQNAALVKRMIAEGHEVGSHSYTSPEGGIVNLPIEDQMSDAINLQNFMQRGFGYNMQKYNFNDGVYSEQSVILMSRMGYEVCFCSCNYSDYDPELEIERDKTLRGLEKSLHNGCVYCFHTTNKITVEILQELIDFVREQGFQIVRLN